MSHICFVFLFILKYTSSLETAGELIFANVLYRHGDRTPIDTYPNDPWRNQSNWPTGWGQLTNIGKLQHLELGRFLRNRYKGLLSDKYSKEEIFIRSTDVDRTLMSALSNLAGLYPPTSSDLWDKDLPWQPIPVHTMPETSDFVLAGKKYCPAYNEELSRIENSDEWKQINKENEELYKYLTANTGKPVNTIELVENLFDCFFIEELYNKTLPKWTNSVYPDKMKGLSEFSFAVLTYTTLLKRLKAGPLLKEMLHNFVHKKNGELLPDRSVWIYSAHDTTVANLLNTLGVFSYHSPPYASCVMMELRKFENNYYVQVFYRNDTTEPKLMNLPNCGTLCPLERMFTLYKPVIPENWETECKIRNLKMGPLLVDIDLLTAIAIVSGSLLVVVLLSALVIGLSCFRHQNYFRTDSRRRYTRLDS